MLACRATKSAKSSACQGSADLECHGEPIAASAADAPIIAGRRCRRDSGSESHESEVCIGYIDVVRPAAWRRRELRIGYGFACQCHECEQALAAWLDWKSCHRASSRMPTPCCTRSSAMVSGIVGCSGADIKSGSPEALECDSGALAPS